MPNESSGTAGGTTPHPGRSVNPPAPLKLDQAQDEWSIFKQQFGIYKRLTELDKKSEEYQVDMFLHCVGTKGIRIYNGLQFESEGDSKKLDKILELFDQHIIGETNETYERYKFNNRSQAAGEKFDDYLTDLIELSKTCNFCNCLKDSLLRDRIVCGLYDNSTRKILLQERKLTLKSAIDIARSAEMTKLRIREFRSDGYEEDVKKVRGTSRKHHRDKPAKKDMKDMICKFCGGKHAMKKSLCPAVGKICKNCKKPDHFAVKCPEKPRVHALETDESDSSDDLTDNAYAVTNDCTGGSSRTEKKDIHAKMLLEGKSSQFLLLNTAQPHNDR
jgi:hypothetical protein